MNNLDLAAEKIRQDAITTNSTIDDEVTLDDDAIWIAGTTPVEVLDNLKEFLLGYDEKFTERPERVNLVFWRMVFAIQYSAYMGMYILGIDRGRLQKFVDQKEKLEEEIIMKQFNVRKENYPTTFTWIKPDEYDAGELIKHSWYFSICDDMGNELYGTDEESELIQIIEKMQDQGDDIQVFAYPTNNDDLIDKKTTAYGDWVWLADARKENYVLGQ